MEEKSKKRKKTDWLGTVGLSLMLTAAVLLVWFFLQGQTVVTGENPPDEKDTLLDCVADGLAYPMFVYDNASNKAVRTKLIFANNKFASVSLVATMDYHEDSDAYTSLVHNEGAINKNLGASGLHVGIFAENYSQNGAQMTMSLYTTASNYDATMGKFFLAGGVSKNATVDAFMENYEKQGFVCTKSE